jgi:hypothetical protein
MESPGETRRSRPREDVGQTDLGHGAAAPPKGRRGGIADWLSRPS